MTLNGWYALCCRKGASFGAHHKNLNKIDPYYQQQKCRPMTLLTGGIRLMRIFAVSWGGGTGATNDSRVVKNSNFQLFRWLFFSDTLEMRPALLYSDTQSVGGFSVIPKCMTLNGYFTLNSVFASVWLAQTVRHSKINCVKTNENRHILSAAQIFGRDCSFLPYKVCADIRLGSLERRR